jgi:hypothetical protein
MGEVNQNPKRQELIESIKLTLIKAKKEPQFYDQKLVSEIEKFMDDTTAPSFELILEKAITLSLNALAKKGLIKNNEKRWNNFILSGELKWEK